MPSFLSICWFLLPSHHAQLCKYLPFESYINNKLDLYCIHYHVYPRKCFSLYTHWHNSAYIHLHLYIYVSINLPFWIKPKPNLHNENEMPYTYILSHQDFYQDFFFFLLNCGKWSGSHCPANPMILFINAIKYNIKLSSQFTSVGKF